MAVQRKYLEMFLEEGVELLAKLNQRVLRLEGSPGETQALQSALRLAHTLKAGASMVGLDNVSRAAHAMESLLQERSDARMALGSEETTRILGTLDRIRAVLDLVAAGREGEAFGVALPPWEPAGAESRPEAPLAAQPPPRVQTESEFGSRGEKHSGAERLRVSGERLDALQNLADDLTLQKEKIVHHMETFRRAFRGLERLGGESANRAFTPKEEDRLRRLVRLLGGRGFQDFLGNLHQLDLMTGALQEQVLDLRMVPVIEVLDRYRRTVRDLAQELGKNVAFAIDGEFTEVDKRLLEAIQAPLTHLVRNAVDHGIEAPCERIQAGKPPRGRVTIRAYQKASAVVIEVEDDGRGLDPARIREKALRERILTPELAQSIFDEEVYHLLCEPGFTTRANVTELSGRGVGLDVVRVRLEKLKGSLAISSEKGRFTRFRMDLPLSTSTLSALIAKAGTLSCAIPSLFVDRCLRVEGRELRDANGTVVQGGRVLPVVSLARLLEEPVDELPRVFPVVILRFRGRNMALQVDAVEPERQVVLKSPETQLKGARYVLGESFVADEQLVPVLNVVDLHSHWPRLEAACRFQPGGVWREG